MTAAAREIKAVLGARLGATLVESSDPLWTPDPEIEPMRTDFRRALARLVPVFMPELLFRLASGRTAGLRGVRGGDRADRVHARQGVRHRHDAADRLHGRDGRGADRAAREPRHRHRSSSRSWRCRSDSTFPNTWPAAPQTGRRWASPRRWSILPALNARSKFWGDDQRAAFKNWEEVADPRNPHGQRQGVDERIMLRELLRRVDMMVILENRLDALVRLHTPWPPGLIGGPPQHGIASNLRPESSTARTRD